MIVRFLANAVLIRRDQDDPAFDEALGAVVGVHPSVIRDARALWRVKRPRNAPVVMTHTTIYLSTALWNALTTSLKARRIRLIGFVTAAIHHYLLGTKEPPLTASRRSVGPIPAGSVTPTVASGRLPVLCIRLPKVARQALGARAHAHGITVSAMIRSILYGIASGALPAPPRAMTASQCLPESSKYLLPADAVPAVAIATAPPFPTPRTRRKRTKRAPPTPSSPPSTA